MRPAATGDGVVSPRLTQKPPWKIRREGLLAGKKELEKTLRGLNQVRRVLESTAQFVALVV